MRRSLLLISALFGLAVSPVYAGGAKKAAPTKKAAAKKAAPAPKPTVAPMVNAEHKKALAEKFGGFKFGMTKDEVLALLQKQINTTYDEKIKATTDVMVQDGFRKKKKEELSRMSSAYVVFDGKQKTGWDVSVIETEFAHGTGESMLDRWENDNGKNNRRFFFFKDQKLWKMYILLDVSMIPEDKRNFETFKGVMEGAYGAGLVEGGTISWRAGEFDARAIDRLKDYSALGLVVEDPKVRTELVAAREAVAPKKAETPSVIKAIIDPEGKDHPDVKANSGAVEAVIQSNGGKK